MDKKILIVEDEKTLLGILVESFTNEGFEVFSAEDGKQGLDSALKNHPDIILLDIIMPVMDGMAMLEELRKDMWGKSSKVIFLTNLSDSEKTIESSKQDVLAYWIKSDISIKGVVTRVIEELKTESTTIPNRSAVPA